ncbi:MAG: hypothetical protein PHX61_08760 [Alphaproteobacteria bacterium]|nr:hypothetical protein [Alphaproteobacteria bacterium]
MNSFAKYSVAGLFAAAVMGSVVYQKEIGNALLTDEANAQSVLKNDPRYKEAKIGYTGYEPLGCLRGEWISTGFVAKYKDGTQTSGAVCKTLFGTTSSIRPS